MYITLTDILNSDVVALSRLIVNEKGMFETPSVTLPIAHCGTISARNCGITAYVFRMSRRILLYPMATITYVTWTQTYSSVMVRH